MAADARIRFRIVTLAVAAGMIALATAWNAEEEGFDKAKADFSRRVGRFFKARLELAPEFTAQYCSPLELKNSACVTGGPEPW